MFLTVFGEKLSDIDWKMSSEMLLLALMEKQAGTIRGDFLRATDSVGRPAYRKRVSCAEKRLEREISVHMPP